MGRFPSGQRGQTVNLLAPPSKVRILVSPNKTDKSGKHRFLPAVPGGSVFFCLYGTGIQWERHFFPAGFAFNAKNAPPAAGLIRGLSAFPKTIWTALLHGQACRAPSFLKGIAVGSPSFPRPAKRKPDSACRKNRITTVFSGITAAQPMKPARCNAGRSRSGNPFCKTNLPGTAWRQNVPESTAETCTAGKKSAVGWRNGKTNRSSPGRTAECGACTTLA